MKIVSLILLLVLLGCSRQIPDGSYEKPFDEVLWRSSEGLEPDKAGLSPRQKMLGDLVDKQLIGRNRREIMAMLGEPSTKMDPDESGPALSYPTGFERGSYVRIDSEWLVIYFDPSGRAIHYKISVD